MCLVVGTTVTIEEVPFGHGRDHPEFHTMQQGGSGVERHQRVVWLGLTFGILQILFYVWCLLLGLREPGKHKWAFILGGILYAGTFSLVVVADQAYIRADMPHLWLSFPVPTAIMLYGVWTVPVLFLVLYVVNFDRWVLTSEDLQKFREFLAAKRRPDNSDN